MPTGNEDIPIKANINLDIKWGYYYLSAL